MYRVASEVEEQVEAQVRVEEQQQVREGARVEAQARAEEQVRERVRHDVFEEEGYSNTYAPIMRAFRGGSIRSELAAVIQRSQCGMFYYVKVAGVVLSASNPLHMLLLNLIFPERYFFSTTLRRHEIERLMQIEAIREYAQEVRRRLIEPEPDLTAVREHLGNFYAVAAAAAGGSGGGGGGDDLPTKIANELAKIYYENLEITLDDVKNVLAKYFKTRQDAKQVNKVFIDKVLNTFVDKGRYPLSMLLPDKNIIKEAIESLYPPNSLLSRFLVWVRSLRHHKNSVVTRVLDRLADYKQAVSGVLDKYICWWKVSIFGHHHNSRARAIKAAIQDASNIQDIETIIERQVRFMMQKEVPEALNEMPTAFWKSTRWNTAGNVKTIPAEPNTSGYYRALCEAISIKP